jgi:Tol biopolymer transport system component
MEDRGQYLVMDYIEGEDLRQRMDRIGLLPEEEAIIVGVAICDALTYLDSCRPPVVHRDIKPGNVKITPEGKIYLVDFGLAKTLHGSQATTTGARAMTPGYSPPEQYGTARTDQRSDIFSLGATLYAALTGAIPEDALARAMDQVGLTSIRKSNSKVSKKLAGVIERSLEVRPDDRFQTAEEFKMALLNCRANSRVLRNPGEYTITPPPGGYVRPIPVSDLPMAAGGEAVMSLPGLGSAIMPRPSMVEDVINRPRTRTRARRRRFSGSGFWLYSILLALLVLTGGLFYYIVNPGGANMLIRRAESLFGTALPAVGLVQPASTATITPTPSLGPPTSSPLPATATSINPSATPNDGAVGGLLAATPTLTPRPTRTVTPTPTYTPVPVATPFGGSGVVAYASDRTGVPEIWVTSTDPKNPNPKQITFLANGACQPSWSPDGKRIVFISPCDANHDFYVGSALFIMNSDGTNLAPVPSAPGGDFDPDWSPDGRFIAFTSLRSSGRPEVYLLDLQDNSVRSLSKKFSRDMQPRFSADGKKIAFVKELDSQKQSVWVMDINGENQERVSRRTEYSDTHPAWSADGKLILITQLLSPNGVPFLYVIPYSDRTAPDYRFSNSEKNPMRDGVYSPDGMWVSYEGWPAGQNHDIYIIGQNGSGRQQITQDGNRSNFDPAWRPFP